MLTRFVRATFAVLLTVTLIGCSTPDGVDLERFMAQIRSMDPGPRSAARREEARGRALEALRSDHDPDDWVGDIECRDGKGNGVIEHFPVRMMIDCLAASSEMTFSACIEARLADFTLAYIEAGPLDPDAKCKYVPSSRFAVDPKWDPDQITDDDLARTAFASPSAPPAWMIAAGVVAIGVGGVFVFASGWAVVLCPLNLEYGCPGDPLAPGDPPAPGGSTGGDR